MQTKNLSRLRHRRQHVHYILVSRSFQFFLVERVWVWFNCRHVSEDVSMTTRQSWEIFKMAVARPRTMVSESFDSFVAPVINKPVPNHLLETSKCVQKCHCTSKVILKWMLVDISYDIWWSIDFVLQKSMPKLDRTLFCRPNLRWFTLLDFKSAKKLPEPLWVPYAILMSTKYNFYTNIKSKLYKMAGANL